MSSPPPEGGDAGGAYGFALRGVDGARELLIDPPPSWPVLELRRRAPDAGPGPTEFVGESRAVVRLAAGGFVALSRDPLRADYALPRPPSDGALVHPHLATAAALAARWLGRESFHAGAVAAGGGAWALLGDKGSGKSTTLARLALAGHAVVSDDLLVLDAGRALAGPRTVDLRRDAAARLGTGEPLGRIGLRERWRMRPGPVAPELPLRGWVMLEWSDGEPALEPLRGARRLAALAPHGAVRIAPEEPATLVALSALPVLVLRRRRDWASLDGAAGVLAEGLARAC